MRTVQKEKPRTLTNGLTHISSVYMRLYCIQTQKHTHAHIRRTNKFTQSEITISILDACAIFGQLVWFRSQEIFVSVSLWMFWVQWFGCIFQWAKKWKQLLQCFAFLWTRTRTRAHTHTHTLHPRPWSPSRTWAKFSKMKQFKHRHAHIHTLICAPHRTAHNSDVRRESCKLRTSNSKFRIKTEVETELEVELVIGYVCVMCAMWSLCFVSTK